METIIRDPHFIAIALIGAGIVSSLFGFRLFRLWRGLWGFALAGIGTAALLQHAVSQFAALTVASLVGLAGAAVTYSSYRISAVALSTAVGLLASWFFLPGALWLCAILALVSIFVARHHAEHLVILCSAAGGLVLCLESLQRLTTLPGVVIWPGSLLLATLGLVFQYITNEGVFRSRGLRSLWRLGVWSSVRSIPKRSEIRRIP